MQPTCGYCVFYRLYSASKPCASLCAYLCIILTTGIDCIVGGRRMMRHKVTQHCLKGRKARLRGVIFRHVSSQVAAGLASGFDVVMRAMEIGS